MGSDLLPEYQKNQDAGLGRFGAARDAVQLFPQTEPPTGEKSFSFPLVAARSNSTIA